MITRIITNQDAPFVAGDGTPISGMRIRWTLVDAVTQQPVDAFDVTTHEQIIPVVITPPTDVTGIMSQALWPTDRAYGEQEVMWKAEQLGVNGVRIFVRPLPSGDDPLSWFEFITGAEIDVDAVTLDDNFILDESQIS